MAGITFYEIVRLVDQLDETERQALIAHLQATTPIDEEGAQRKSRPGDFRKARGVFAWSVGDEPAEVTIRRLRDDE